MKLFHSSSSRVWTIENGARPDRHARYRGLAAVGRVNRALGTVAPVYGLDEGEYDDRMIDDLTQEPRGLAETSITFRARHDESEMMALVTARCPVDLQIHVGECSQPNDYESWQRGKIVVIRRALASAYTLDGVGSLDRDGMATEPISFTGRDAYEILPLKRKRIATGLDDIVAMATGEYRACSGCPITRITVAVAADGIAYTLDNITWTAVAITFADTPLAVAILNGYVIVTTDAPSHVWILVSALRDGESETVAVSTGYVGEANALYVLRSRGQAFAAGENGYIYRIDDAESAVEAAHEAALTLEDLNAVHGVGSTIVTVGDANTIVASRNDGKTWRLVTGPGGTLLAVACISETTWLVGTSAGRLYYTIDEGVSWTEIAHRGSGTGSVEAIVFVDDLVGYMLKTSYVFRTVDGGATWHRLTDTVAAHSALAAPEINIVFDGADSGELFKFSA